ncbi:MAG: tripartite tricarboxylate transporter TctB family protein [Spirochaetaceae bacterium]|nr:tripartite tricarboxylate transporter TctB family protein [Spirochaetaceae bacterium]
MNFKKEIGVGIFFLLLSVFYLLSTLSISTFDPFSSGRSGIILDSRSLPQMLGILLACLSIIHIIGNVLKLRKTKLESGSDTQAVMKKPFKFERPQRLMVITVLLICAYIFFYVRLGFILSSVLFLLLQIFILTPAEKRKKWAIFTVCFSIGVPILLYFLFTRVISMYLPRGLLG